jgi:hypothetical protein
MTPRKTPRAAKSGFKLLVNPGDLGLFIGLAHSRPRLITSSLCGTALSMACAWGVSTWIRNGGSGPIANVAVIIAMFLGMFLVSYVNTMLIGDLFFSGRWRERVLLKQAVEVSTIEEDIAAAKDYSLHFLVINLAMILCLLLLSEQVTGGFLRYYQTIGGTISLLRSDDPTDRALGLSQLSHALNSERWSDATLHAEIVKLIDDPDEAVRTQAFFSAGRMQIIDASPAMFRHLRDPKTPPAVRAEAATALGRLQYSDAALDLMNLLEDPNVTNDERLGALYGLIFWSDPLFGPSLLAPLKRCSLLPDTRLTPQQVALLFYSVTKTDPKGASAVALDWLEGGPCAASPEEQCAAAETLRRIGDDDDIPRLQAAYSAADVERRCEGQYWTYRDEATVSLVEPELLRAKVIKAVGNRKSFKVFGWLRAIHQDASLPLKLRNVAATNINSLDLIYQDECPSERRTQPRCRIE